MTDDPQARKEDYWDSLDSEQDVGTPLAAQVQDAADEWDVRGITVTGVRDDGTLVLQVLRQRVGDVGLLFRFGYAFADPDENEFVGWSENYVDMRANPGLTNGLLRLFAAVDQGGATPDDPLLLDARGDTAVDNPDELLDAPELDQDVEQDVEQDVDLDRDRDPKQSVEDKNPDTVRCQKCGDEIPRSAAENFGSLGIGGDAWVHEGGCE
jgi:hypothetical protein